MVFLVLKVMVWNMNSKFLTDEDLTAQPLGPQKSWGIFLEKWIRNDSWIGNCFPIDFQK